MPTTQTASNASMLPGSAVTTNTLLFDTNVWLDYFFDRAGVSNDIVDLIECAKFAGDTIATTVSIKKDVYYIVPRELRRRAAAIGGHGDEQPSETLFKQVAWALLEQMDELATVVPLSLREDFFARHIKDEHNDYEDDALVATARAIGAKCIVTSDLPLLRHFPNECRTPAQALAIYRDRPCQQPR